MRWDRGTDAPEPASEPDLIGVHDANAEPARETSRSATP